VGILQDLRIAESLAISIQRAFVFEESHPPISAFYYTPVASQNKTQNTITDQIPPAPFSKGGEEKIMNFIISAWLQRAGVI
jgi:hypothetical protein